MRPRSIEVILVAVLIGTLVTLSETETAWASNTIYIRADGSVDPPTAPIQRTGDLYTFTANINESIVIQKDNIIIDGNDHLLNGSGTGSGFNLTNRINVTIKNSHIANFEYGIRLTESDGNTLTHNVLDKNEWAGILISNSSSNLISRNTVFNNTHDGILLWERRTQNNIITANNVSHNGAVSGGGNGISIGLKSSYNTISNNTLSHNAYASIELGYEDAIGNVITANNITDTWIGIYIDNSRDNILYHNNIMHNTDQANLILTANLWDNGYLPGGNYWSDYTGQDLNGDGIGDTPYIINGDPNNQDNYPFMNPWTPQAYDIAITEVEPSKIYVGQGCDVRINVTVTNQGSYTQTFNTTAYANQTKIETKTIILASQSTEILTFTWNTLGVTKGFYTLNATADQMPGEIDTLDNTHTNGNIKITIAGDVNGDTIVNVHDLYLIGKAYGSTPPTNTNCDINEDKNVNQSDLEIAAGNYSQES